MNNHRGTVLVASISSILSLFVGISLTLWAKLPDHTVDFLAFTESMFGISITILAGIEALRIFDLKDKVMQLERFIKQDADEIQQKFQEQFANMERKIDEVWRDTPRGQTESNLRQLRESIQTKEREH